MKEEKTFAFKDQTGFRISKCDLTTGKVVINGIEITSIEDWEKVTKSIIDLQSQLKGIQEERDYLFNKLSIENKSLQSQLKAKEEEIEKQFKSMSAVIQHNSDLYLEESNKLIKERQQLKEVIKEAREYVKEFKFATVGFYLHAPALDNILSKGENK